MADKLVRRNLMVDADKLRELARCQGNSESAAVRQAIEHALAAQEVMSAIRQLHASDGIRDVSGRLLDELE